MRIVMPAIAMLFAASCASTTSTKALLMPGYKLPPKPSFVVVAVPDGQEHGQAAAGGTGRQMQFLIVKEVMRFGFPADPSQSLDVNAAFVHAAGVGATHVLKGTFTHWEDNATEWSGEADRVSFMLEVYAVDGRKFLGTVTEDATGEGLALTSKSATLLLPHLAARALWPVLHREPVKAP
jgi:hypothetical protein